MVYVQAADRIVDIVIIFSPKNPYIFFLFFKLFIFGCAGSSWLHRLSLAASRDYLLVAVLGLLVAVSSLAAEHGLQHA